MKRILNKILAAVVSLFALFSFPACDSVLQYPDGEGVDPTLINIHVRMSVDFTIIGDTLFSSYADSRSGDFDVRYQLAFYALSGEHVGELVLHKTWTSDVIQSGLSLINADVDLHAEQYAVYAWIDFVPRGTTADFYYVTDDLRKVSIVDSDISGLDTRDAFAGKTTVDLTPYRNVRFADITIPLSMERPFGKFKIVATDVRKFLDSYKQLGTYADVVPALCTLSYTCYFPTIYSLDTRLAHADGFRLGVTHSNLVSEMEGYSAVLASDYVLICNDNTTVVADLQVKNSAGQLLTTVRGITIPIQRNRLTIVSGEFLTSGVTGGAVIAPDFDGEFNIQI